MTIEQLAPHISERVSEQISEYAGLRRQFEVGLRLAPTEAQAAVAAKSLASILDAFPHVPVRLVEIARETSRVHITVAVCLGTIDDVKTAAPAARVAVTLLQRIIDALAAYDPAFVQLPAGGGFVALQLDDLVDAVG